ncbi:hypothetical protein C2845_PM11G27970 [Panicum miliaceum]|uniref:GH10 domain-containing protein n=1 Tax=Panicum miliaceum TaxID=4540 RepID=A0A3L6RWY3_PANMI|nr:hypothetical protein C2845_PM11G27970 [Panicum miliaceum]
MENEMKWYTARSSTRWPTGCMLELAQRHNISVRGHNVLWDDQSHQMDWAAKLDTPELKDAGRRPTRQERRVALRECSGVHSGLYPPVSATVGCTLRFVLRLSI